LAAANIALPVQFTRGMTVENFGDAVEPFDCIVANAAQGVCRL
jgi:hypothetical protein